MKPLLKKFILILFIGLISISNFSCECSRMEEVPLDQLRQIADPIAIADWDKATLDDIAKEIFQENSFGDGVDNGGIIFEMCDLFTNYKEQPHIALMRVLLLGQEGNILRAYSIPYVFVSGKDGATAITKWARGLNETWKNLNNSINAGSIGNKLIKGIGDYGYSCQKDYWQFFAHSERACVLCLLYDLHHSIGNIIENIQGNYTAVSKIVIQIKLIKNVPCDDCCDFLNCKSYVSDKQFVVSNALYPFNIIQPLKDEITRRMTKSIPIEFRFSSNNGQPIVQWIN